MKTYWIECGPITDPMRQRATEPVNVQPTLQAALQQAQFMSRQRTFGLTEAEAWTVFAIELDADGEPPVNGFALPYSIGITRCPVNGPDVMVEKVAAYRSGRCVGF